MARPIQIKTVGVKGIRERLSKKKLGPLLKKTHNTMVREWQKGAEAFVRASVRQVLVESGMSAASYFPLSRAINRARAVAAVQSQVAQGRTASRSKAPLLPDGRSASFKASPSAGEKLGRDAFRFTVGSPARPVFTFQFSTVVYQHAFHEPSQKSLDIGFEAFRGIIDQRFVKIVAVVLSEFITLKTRTRRIVEGNT